LLCSAEIGVAAACDDARLAIVVCSINAVQIGCGRPLLNMLLHFLPRGHACLMLCEDGALL
jgi:hypothetical protein